MLSQVNVGNFNAVVLSCKHLQSSALPRGMDFMDTALSGVSLPPPLLAAVQRFYQHYKAALFLQNSDLKKVKNMQS